MSYLTNARSSFCNDIPVNWATTIERNPVALLPSASIPFIPHTERREQLKMYGDAPDTVSVSIVIVADAALGFGGRLFRTNGKIYVNSVALTTLVTFVDIL